MVFASLFPSSFVVGFLSSAILPLPSLLSFFGELSYCLSFLAYIFVFSSRGIRFLFYVISRRRRKFLTLIEPGKNNIPSFKDQGCDVRSVGRSSRSMRQAVACSMWEIFCNEMN
uniref:Uncharacterized protein n=1 Tax=Ombrophytum subterraneum TaxID=50155 RepID=A0A6M8Q0H1_9MAGN|nr:hypothetical protein [Ombrophytum subterraneum]